MNLISDRIKTGSEWADGDCVIIESSDVILFSDVFDLDKWKHGKAVGQIVLNLNEAKLLYDDIGSKIRHYESIDDQCNYHDNFNKGEGEIRDEKQYK